MPYDRSFMLWLKLFSERRVTLKSASLLLNLLPNPILAYAAALHLKGHLQFSIFGWLHFHAASKNLIISDTCISQLPTGLGQQIQNQENSWGKYFKSIISLYYTTFFPETHCSEDIQSSRLMLWPSTTFLWSPDHSETCIPIRNPAKRNAKYWFSPYFLYTLWANTKPLHYRSEKGYWKQNFI